MADQYGPPNNVIGSGSLDVFGGGTIPSYNSVSNQYAKSANSYNEATKDFGTVSAASGLGAIGAGVLGQPEVSAGLSVVSGFSGVGASVTGYLGAQDSNVAGYAQTLANVALQRAEGLPVSAQQQTDETDSFGNLQNAVGRPTAVQIQQTVSDYARSYIAGTFSTSVNVEGLPGNYHLDIANALGLCDESGTRAG